MTFDPLKEIPEMLGLERGARGRDIVHSAITASIASNSRCHQC